MIRETEPVSEPVAESTATTPQSTIQPQFSTSVQVSMSAVPTNSSKTATTDSSTVPLIYKSFTVFISSVAAILLNH